MTKEEHLSILIESLFETKSNFADAIGMPVSTLNSILRRGINKTTIQNLKLICDGLHISVEQLANCPREFKTPPVFLQYPHVAQTSTEKQLLEAYRMNPQMWPAIHKLLDIKTDTDSE